MEDLYHFILGAFQGLTEFLPVSSSGHLAVLQHFFSQSPKESLLIEIAAHLGSLLAILIYYRSFLFLSLSHFQNTKNLELKKLLSLFISTLPAGLCGLFLKDKITLLFSEIHFVALAFLCTAALLLLMFYLSSKKQQTDEWPNYWQALVIGLFQAFALLPGISRAGSTIASGIIVGVKPEAAAKFSFLSVSPLILAAAGLSALELISQPETLNSVAWQPILVLFISSFVFSYIGLFLVLKFLQRAKLHYFAAYLIPLSISLFIWG